MNNKYFTIAIVTVILLCIVGYFYVTNVTVKDRANSLVNKYLLGEKSGHKEGKIITTSQPSWFYEIVDATDIEDKQYAIPRIDTSHISQIIDWQYQNGGGKYSITYIDNYSKDNDVKYFAVPATAHRNPAPVQKEGEISYEYYNQKKAYETYLQKFMMDSINEAVRFYHNKRIFLEECCSFLNNTVYVVGSPTHQRTDAVGSLNASFRSMNLSHVSFNKFLILFSDLEDNVGGTLMPQPDDIKVVVVNPVPGCTKKILGEVPEVQSKSEVLERIQKLVKNN